MRTLLILIAAVVTGPLHAEPCGPVNLGDIGLGTEAHSFAGHGEVAYVASESGLHVIDASEPGVPTVAGFLAFPQSTDVCADGDLLYLLGDLGLYLVLDITNPLAPAAIGTGLASGDPDQIVADGPLALTVDRSTRVTILDVSDPNAPKVAGHIDRQHVEDADVAGTTGYLLSNQHEGEVIAYDLSNPASPALLGAWNVGEYASDLLADDGLLYVSAEGGIKCFDASDPSNLTLLDTLPGLGGTLSLADGALLVHSSAASVVVDVSDPTDLRIMVEGRAPSSANQIGGMANLRSFFWHRKDDRFSVLDMSVPNAAPVGRMLSEFRLTSLCHEGDMFYAADHRGVLIIDASDPSAPVHAGFIPTDDHPYGLEADGDLLYITAGRSGLLIVDISNPANPNVLGTVPATGTQLTTDVEVRWPFAYLANYSNGISAAYVADPANPFVINTEGVFGDASRIKLKGPTVYVAVVLPVAWATVDVLNAGEPELKARGSFPAWGGIEFIGDRVLLSAANSIHVMDERPDGSLEQVAMTQLPHGPEDLDRSGSLVLATGSKELYLVDFADPLAPEFVSAISLAPAEGDARGPISFYQSVWHDGLIFTATDQGLFVFDPTPCGGCVSDLTRDSKLNIDDVSLFVARYLEASIAADLDGDGAITLDDLDAFVAAFLGGCP